MILTHWKLKRERQFLGLLSYKHKSRYASWRQRQCAVLGLHQDAQVTTQKSGRKIGPADQWTQSVFQVQWSRWVASHKVSREKWGRPDSLHCSGCFVSLGSTDSHKFQSLQVKTPIAMHSSMRPNPAPFSTTQPTPDCLLARTDFLFPVSAKCTTASNSSYPGIFIDPLHLVSYRWHWQHLPVNLVFTTLGQPNTEVNIW